MIRAIYVLAFLGVVLGGISAHGALPRGRSFDVARAGN